MSILFLFRIIIRFLYPGSCPLPPTHTNFFNFICFRMGNGELDTDQSSAESEIDPIPWKSLLSDDIQDDKPYNDDLKLAGYKYSEWYEDDFMKDASWVYQSFSENGSMYHDGLPGVYVDPSVVSLEYQSTDRILLDKAKIELKTIIKNVKKLVNDSTDPLSLFLACIPSQLLVLFADWIKEPFTLDDLASYLRVEIQSRFYDISVSTLEKGIHGVISPNDLVMHKKILESMKKVDQPNSSVTLEDNSQHNSPYSISPILMPWEHACALHWSSLFFVSGESWIDIDDDKLPFSAKRSFESYGIRMVPVRRGGTAPVVHLASSTSTGLILGGYIEEFELKPHHIIKRIICNLFSQCIEITQASVEARRKLLVFIDRGYLQLANENKTTNIVQLLHNELQVGFIGTLKESRTSPFKGSPRIPELPVSANQVLVSVYGTRSTYVAEDRKKGLVAVALRHGKGKARKITLLSNFSLFRKQVWVAEVSKGLDNTSGNNVKRSNQGNEPPSVQYLNGSTFEEETTSDLAYVYLQSRIYILTSKQRTMDWFVARTFRITGTVAFVSVNFDSASFLTEDMKESHNQILDMAQLTPKKVINLSNATEESFNSLESQPVPSGNRRGGTGKRGRKADLQSNSYWNKFSKSALEQCCQERCISLTKGWKKSEAVSKLANYELQSSKRNKTISDHQESESDNSENSDNDSVEEEEAQSNEILENSGDDSSVNSDESFDEVSFEDRQLCFLRTIMRYWFMSPFDEATLNKAHSPVHLGSANEKAALKSLPIFFEKYVEKYRIENNSIREYGLVCSRSVQVAADSPDGVAGIMKRDSDGRFSFSFLAALEIKSKTSSSTQFHLANVAHGNKFMECDAGSQRFKDLVENPSYRVQLIHHAAVLGLDYSLIIFDDLHKIQQCILLKVTRAQRETYLNYMKSLSDNYLQFAYSTNSMKIPRLGNDRDVKIYGYALDHHTVELYLQLWRAHSYDAIVYGVSPPWQRVLPMIASVWNKFMGNVDLARKVINSSKQIYSRANPLTLIWGNLLNYCLYNGFRLYQLFLMKDRIDSLNTYKKYCTEKKAKCSYKEFLFAVFKGMNTLKLEEHFPQLRQMLSKQGKVSRSTSTSTTEFVVSPIMTRNNQGEGKSFTEKKRQKLFLANTEKEFIDRRLNKDIRHEQRLYSKKGKHCDVCCRLCLVKKPHETRVGRQTMYYCGACNVSLCTRNDCWDRYHHDSYIPYPECSKKN